MRWVISCEHASKALPDGMDLGLSEQELDGHESWDPGARELALALGEVLGVEPFMGQFSRVLVDLNRRPEGPRVVPEVSFGLPVPGNQGLSPEAREERLRRWHKPHWDAVHAAVRAGLCDGPVVHLSVHSFAPVIYGVRREVQVGLLFDPKRPLEQALVDRALPLLRAQGFDSRANEPYTGWGDGITVWLRTLYGPADYLGLELEWNHGLPRSTQAAVVSTLVQLAGDGALR